MNNLERKFTIYNFIKKSEIDVEDLLIGLNQQEAEKFKAFHWNVIEVEDGNNCQLLKAAYEAAKKCLDKPTLVLAHTTKGKGVSYMEGIAKWHHGVPTAEQYEEAVREVSERIEKLEKENNGK